MNTTCLTGQGSLETVTQFKKFNHSVKKQIKERKRLSTQAHKMCITPFTLAKPLPDSIRRGIEFLSGYDMSDVQVHYNSPWPEYFQAQAFAYGTDIYLSPGAESSLAHEAWHVVQQKQGRVQVTGSINDYWFNDERELEEEADKASEIIRLHSFQGDCQSQTGQLKKGIVEKPVIQQELAIGEDLYQINNRMSMDALWITIKDNKLLDKIVGKENLEFKKKLLKEIILDMMYDADTVNGSEDLNEKLTKNKYNMKYVIFNTWQEFEKEVIIRSAGYLAVNQMNKLMKDYPVEKNNQLTNIKIGEEQKIKNKLKEDLAKINHDWKRKKRELAEEWKKEYNKLVTEGKNDEDIQKIKKLKELNAKKIYDEMKKKLTAKNELDLKKLEDEYCRNTFIWTTASYLEKDVNVKILTAPLFLWLTNESNILPQRMNCWETVIFSFYLAGVINKDYMVWANFRVKTPKILSGLEGFGKKTISFLIECYKNHDVYCNIKKTEISVSFKSPNKDFREDRPWIPEDLIVPRGRIVIFADGAHVAISTGKSVKLGEKAKSLFQRDYGHGILEIDGVTSGVTETTMEDIITVRRMYSTNYIIAPLPICNSTNNITMIYEDHKVAVLRNNLVRKYMGNKKLDIKSRNLQSEQMIDDLSNKKMENLKAKIKEIKVQNKKDLKKIETFYKELIERELNERIQKRKKYKPPLVFNASNKLCNPYGDSFKFRTEIKRTDKKKVEIKKTESKGVNK